MALARFCLQAGRAAAGAAAAGAGAAAAGAAPVVATGVRTSADVLAPVRCSTVTVRGAGRAGWAGWTDLGGRGWARMQSGAMNGQAPHAGAARGCRSAFGAA